MVDSGLISKQTKESDKRRKEYALTGRGEWVAEEIFASFVRRSPSRSILAQMARGILYKSEDILPWRQIPQVGRTVFR